MADHHDYDGIRYREEKHAPRVFRVLFVLLSVWGIAFMAYYLFSGWSSRAEADAAGKAREAQKQSALTVSGSIAAKQDHGEGRATEHIARGKQVYAASCAACHGENARGSVGPDLTASRYKFGKSRAEIVISIAEGRPGGMPGFKGQLSQEQIEGVTEYVLSLK